MAKILLNKIPICSNGDLLFSYDVAINIHKNIQSILDEECPEDNYVVITTPTELSSIDGNTKIICIGARSYSSDELLEAVEKASIYDELCR